MKTITKLWLLIIILAMLTPIGIFLPSYFRAGAAWGEWGLDEIKALVGYLPAGLGRTFAIYGKAPIPDYGQGAARYIASAILGVVVITAAMFLLGKFLSRPR